MIIVLVPCYQFTKDFVVIKLFEPVENLSMKVLLVCQVHVILQALYNHSSYFSINDWWPYSQYIRILQSRNQKTNWIFYWAEKLGLSWVKMIEINTLNTAQKQSAKCVLRKRILWKISQNSLESTCARVSSK